MHFKIQTAPFTDQITADGIALTKRPYPFITDERGEVLNTKSLAGHPAQVIGFVKDLNDMHVDMWWNDALKSPLKTLGMYLVSLSEEGVMATHLTAVESFETHAA